MMETKTIKIRLDPSDYTSIISGLRTLDHKYQTDSLELRQQNRIILSNNLEKKREVIIDLYNRLAAAWWDDEEEDNGNSASDDLG